MYVCMYVFASLGICAYVCMNGLGCIDSIRHRVYNLKPIVTNDNVLKNMIVTITEFIDR